jgi:anti-sigma B factor antagonist
MCEDVRINQLLTVTCCQPGTRGGRIAVCGEIDLSNAASLRGLLAPLTAGADELVVDLGEVTFCDTSGLRALLDVNSAARARGHRLVLWRVRRHLRSVLDATRLAGEFDIDDADEPGEDGTAVP